MSEVKPKFAPRVQAIWDECGTYVDSINPEVAAGELEYFVQQLIQSVCKEFFPSVQAEELLTYEGYVNE